MNESNSSFRSILQSLNRVHIKLIAFITMTIDHIGSLFFPRDLTWRYVGRIAFPLFAIGIGEGVAHTKNHRKYLFRLTIFAFISEIPFNLMHDNRLFDLSGFTKEDIQFFIENDMLKNIIKTNVVFTLLAGACICVLIGKKLKIWEYVLYSAIPMAVLYLNSDYGLMGIITVVVSYISFALPEKYSPINFSAVAAIVILSYGIGQAQMWALLAIIPIVMYNGKSGRFKNEIVNKAFSFVIYWYYPLHQLVLWYIRYKM